MANRLNARMEWHKVSGSPSEAEELQPAIGFEPTPRLLGKASFPPPTIAKAIRLCAMGFKLFCRDAWSSLVGCNREERGAPKCPSATPPAPPFVGQNGTDARLRSPCVPMHGLPGYLATRVTRAQPWRWLSGGRRSLQQETRMPSSLHAAASSVAVLAASDSAHGSSWNWRDEWGPTTTQSMTVVSALDRSAMI